jgi:hypothetical protein
VRLPSVVIALLVPDNEIGTIPDTDHSETEVEMLWVLLTPLMLLGLAVATVPIIVATALQARELRAESPSRHDLVAPHPTAVPDEVTSQAA